MELWFRRIILEKNILLWKTSDFCRFSYNYKIRSTRLKHNITTSFLAFALNLISGFLSHNRIQKETTYMVE